MIVKYFYMCNFNSPPNIYKINKNHIIKWNQNNLWINSSKWGFSLFLFWIETFGYQLINTWFSSIFLTGWEYAYNFRDKAFMLWEYFVNWKEKKNKIGIFKKMAIIIWFFYLFEYWFFFILRYPFFLEHGPEFVFCSHLIAACWVQVVLHKAIRCGPSLSMLIYNPKL